MNSSDVKSAPLFLCMRGFLYWFPVFEFCDVSQRGGMKNGWVEEEGERTRALGEHPGLGQMCKLCFLFATPTFPAP